MPMQIEQGFAPSQWDKASLAGQVDELERKIDMLRDIAGAAVATMKVNRERGTLKFDDPEAGARFEMWVEAWNQRLNECSNAFARGTKGSTPVAGVEMYEDCCMTSGSKRGVQ